MLSKHAHKIYLKKTLMLSLSICGGGCPKHAADMFNNIQGIDKPFCIHTKYALKELLKEFAKNNTPYSSQKNEAI